MSKDDSLLLLQPRGQTFPNFAQWIFIIVAVGNMTVHFLLSMYPCGVQFHSYICNKTGMHIHKC